MEIVSHQYQPLPPDSNAFYLQRPVEKNTDIVLALERLNNPEVWRKVEIGVRFGCSYLSGGKMDFEPWEIVEIARVATQYPDHRIAAINGVTRMKVRSCRKAVDRAALMVQNGGIVTPETAPVLTSDEKRVYDIYRGHRELQALLKNDTNLRTGLHRQPHLNWLLENMAQGWHIGQIATHFGLGITDNETHNVSAQIQNNFLWERTTRIPHKFLQRIVFANYIRSHSNWSQQYVDGLPFAVAKQVLSLGGDNFWIELRRFFALLFDRERQINPGSYASQYDFINQSSECYGAPRSLTQVLSHVVQCQPVDNLLDIHNHLGYSRQAVRSAYSVGLRYIENVLLMPGSSNPVIQAKRQRSKELKEWSMMLHECSVPE